MGMDFGKIKSYIDRIVITDDLLEIGSDRGEGSTTILGSIAQTYQKTLHSVDMDVELINRNRQKHQSMPINFYNAKGEDFLDQVNNLKFSVILLDNFDWDFVFENKESPWYTMIKDQQVLYKSAYQLEMTNINSQIAHLVQAIKLTNMMSDQCIVICDDTYTTNNQTFDGKCGAVVPYLMSLGFKPYTEINGVVMIRNEKING